MTLLRTEGSGESLHSYVPLAAFKQSRRWEIWAPKLCLGSCVLRRRFDFCGMEPNA